MGISVVSSSAAEVVLLHGPVESVDDALVADVLDDEGAEEPSGWGRRGAFVGGLVEIDDAALRVGDDDGIVEALQGLVGHSLRPLEAALFFWRAS